MQKEEREQRPRVATLEGDGGRRHTENRAKPWHRVQLWFPGASQIWKRKHRRLGCVWGGKCDVGRGKSLEI